ncbi:MAG: hypothetical protein E5X48_28040 [Mesorhizobium sp.]|nr:MAG: hypothetical protein E5X48_28040 [Mesorhizobium sp.]
MGLRHPQELAGGSLCARRSKHSRGRVPSRPPLACRPSPPRGGRSDVASAFANQQRCRKNAGATAANLPPCGGDVRQDRGGRCPAGVSALGSPAPPTLRHPRA